MTGRRSSPSIRRPDARTVPDDLLCPTVQHAAAPTRPIEGVIRDKDTDGPSRVSLLLAWSSGRTVRLAASRRGNHRRPGRYRLEGLAKGAAYQLFLEPGEGLPYIKANFRVPADLRGPEPLKFDIAMKRGILVRGRVTDKATGRTVGQRHGLCLRR